MTRELQSAEGFRREIEEIDKVIRRVGEDYCRERRNGHKWQANYNFLRTLMRRRRGLEGYLKQVEEENHIEYQ